MRTFSLRPAAVLPLCCRCADTSLAVSSHVRGVLRRAWKHLTRASTRRRKPRKARGCYSRGAYAGVAPASTRGALLTKNGPPQNPDDGPPADRPAGNAPGQTCACAASDALFLVPQRVLILVIAGRMHVAAGIGDDRGELRKRRGDRIESRHRFRAGGFSCCSRTAKRKAAAIGFEGA